jgi:hypothetical protein
MSNSTPDIDTSTWPIQRLEKNVVLNLCGVGWNPRECFDDIWPDIDRLIKAIIYGSTDPKNINLHQDELYGEMVYKMTQIMNRRDIVFKNRAGFFGLLKLCLSHHLSSLIQRHVYTEKRTGVKPPKRGEKPKEVEEEVEHAEFTPTQDRHGNIELDDDEHGVVNYVGQEDAGFKERETRDALCYFMKEHLTTTEARVLKQEMEPNDRAIKLAFASTQVSKRRRTYKVQDRHKAEGIGMRIYAYKRTLGKIRVKMLKYWNK